MRGADFLHMPMSNWDEVKMNEVCVSIQKIASNPCTSINGKNINAGFLQYTLKRTNFLIKAMGIVCAVIKCVQIWKSQLKSSKHDTDYESDMHTAKLALIQATQWKLFKEILTQMQLGQSYQQALAHVKNQAQFTSSHHQQIYSIFRFRRDPLCWREIRLLSGFSS